MSIIWTNHQNLSAVKLILGHIAFLLCVTMNMVLSNLCYTVTASGRADRRSPYGETFNNKVYNWWEALTSGHVNQCHWIVGISVNANLSRSEEAGTGKWRRRIILWFGSSSHFIRSWIETQKKEKEGGSIKSERNDKRMGFISSREES